MARRMASPSLLAVGWLGDHQVQIGMLVGGILAWLCGPDCPVALQFALAMIIVDTVTGLLGASFWQCLNEQFGWNGFRKKLGMIVVLGFGLFLDWRFGTGQALTGTISFLVGTQELVSVLKNLTVAGVAIPPALQALAQRLFEKSQEDAVRSFEVALKAVAGKEKS
jgi:toxin secretion/phage lysis holin